MFARPKYSTRSMIKQHALLVSVAEMIDKGKLRTTMGENLGTINASIERRHMRCSNPVVRAEGCPYRILKSPFVT